MKKNILVTFGIGDTFCDEESPRCIKRGKTGPSLAKEVNNILEDSSDHIWGSINVHESSDTNLKVNPFEKMSPSRVLDLTLCSESVFHTNNMLIVMGSNGQSETVMDGDQFDHVLPPSDYKLFVAGIDINGIFTSFVDEALEMGYEIVVYSNAIKPLNKDTITHIISASKDRNKALSFRKG
jgi:hypothetical protein